MNTTSLKGKLLVATPQLESPLFSRSVVLLLEHSEEEGARGVILNLPTTATMTDLAGKLFDEDFVWNKPLLLGGPVAGPLVVLHTRRDMADLEIAPGIYLALDATKSQELISGETEPSLVIANFSGWEPGQLEAELDQQVWLTAPADSAHVFFGDDRDIWRTTLHEITAEKLKRMFNLRELPDDPSVN